MLELAQNREYTVRSRRFVAFEIACVLGAFLLAGCSRYSNASSGKLTQRGYLWQRDWTPAVNDALTEAARRLDGVIVLGGEVDWTEKGPTFVRSNINWSTLRSRGIPCSLALRISPFRDQSRPERTQFIANAAKSLIDDATAHHVAIAEFQLDFDCPQRDLLSYRSWVRQVREVVHPIRFVITTLPAWLREPDFQSLLTEADGFVLQVHSVPASTNSASAKLCDANFARKWVKEAARFGRMFSVALPTYRCTAGYDASGKLLSVAMDSVQPAWPSGTRVLEFTTPADEIADLIGEWQRERPRGLREIIWYRIPLATDLRNWRWPTLAAVMSGRKPARRLEILTEGTNPIDLSIDNTGENDEPLHSFVTVMTDGEPVVAADALSGWNVEVKGSQVVFKPDGDDRVRLLPGEKCAIGWLRCQRPANLRFALSGEK